MDISALGPWQPLLAKEFEKPYFASLSQAVDCAYAEKTVYPPKGELFSAFSLTAPDKVRVVILGQDPYHEPGQAHGLAFSVKPGAKLPPSLRNIYKELSDDLGICPPLNGYLAGWAKQGVFLLNSVLTVEEGHADSHKNFGWQTFTDSVVAALCNLPQPIAFILWGSQAQKKADLAAKSSAPRLVLCSAHPSPLSAYRGFFGSRPFSSVNRFFEQSGQAPIDWSAGA